MHRLFGGLAITSSTMQCHLRKSFAFAFALCACSSGGDEPAQDWIEVEGFPEATALYAVWSFASDDVWVAADGGKMLHFDGHAWTSTDLGLGATMLDIWGFAPDDIWAVGGAMLARYDGSDWEVIDLTREAAGISGVGTIWGTSPSDVWVGGEQSTAAHFDGTSWTRYIAAGTENVALWGSASDDVYVGGLFGVAHWNGAQWEPVEDDIRGASAVWGFSADDVWVADNHELFHFDGRIWDRTELDGIGDVEAMWGARGDDIWGVGSFGSIAHFDGRAWREVRAQPFASPYLETFVDVHGSSSTDVWAVGVRYGDDGITPRILSYSP
jgi:hypothetical protein